MMKLESSLGLFYSVITAFLGFEINEGEYKVMGMSAYGKPVFLDQSSQLELSFVAIPVEIG